MKKQVDVVMLPTEKASKIWLKESTLSYNDDLSSLGFIPQHLYFLSDDKIKEGDWYIDKLGIVQQCESIRDNPLTGPQSSIGSVGGKGFDKWSTQYQNRDYKDLDNCFKIVATTDESLVININGNRGDLLPDVSFDITLPRPSNEFIKKYCELGGIDEVLVEYKCSYEDCNMFGCHKYEGCHLIQQLKVAPDNTISIYPITNETQFK